MTFRSLYLFRAYFSMVGHKFIEALKEKDPSNKFNVVTFCEENRAAYNRMRLTEVRMPVPFSVYLASRSLAAWQLRFCDQAHGRAQPREAGSF